MSSEKTGKRDFLTVVLPMWNVGELAGSRKFFHIFDATQHRFISVRCSVGCFLRWMREIVGRIHCEPNLQWVRDVPLGVPSSWQSGATIAQEMFLSVQETLNGYMLPAKSMFSSLLPENCVSRRSCRRACGSRCPLLETRRHHTERLSSSQVESATESEMQREAARDFDEPDSRRFSNKSSESPRPESLPQLVAATVATSLPDVSFWRSHHKLVQVWSLAPHQAVLPSSCPEVYMPICAVIPGAVGGLAFGCGRGPLGAGVGAAVGAAVSELGRQLLSRLPETVYLRDHSWIWSDYKGEYLMRHIEAKPWFPQYELGIAFCALVGATLQGSVCLHAYLLGEISVRDLLRRLLVAFRTGATSWSLTALIMYILHCGQFCTTGGLHRALTIVMAHRSSAVFGIHNCVFGAVQWLQEQGKQVTELAALTGASVTALLISFALGCDMCPLQLRIPLVGMAAQCGGSIAYANLLKARKLVLQARLCELAREVLGLPSGHTEAELHQRLSILVRLAHPTSNCSVGAAASVRLFVRCRDVLLVDADVGKDRQFVRLIKVWARRNVSITDQLPSVGLAADEISL